MPSNLHHDLHAPPAELRSRIPEVLGRHSLLRLVRYSAPCIGMSDARQQENAGLHVPVKMMVGKGGRVYTFYGVWESDAGHAGVRKEEWDVVCGGPA